MKVSIVNVQVPFVRGGAEYLADSLAEKVRERGHLVDQLRIPFKWYPLDCILDHMLSCRLIDPSVGDPDLVIALKFPAYLVPFENKKVWLLHQHRQVYDEWETPDGCWGNVPGGLRLREAIVAADNRHLTDTRGLYTNSATVADRLRRYNGIEPDGILFPPLLHPEAFHCGESGNYVFYPSRISRFKRQHVAIEAMRHVRSGFKLVVAGQADEDSFQHEIDELVRAHGLEDRVQFLGWISEEEKARWMADAFAVLYLPVDEDSYGYVTLEAFHSSKPVITFTDSGGTNELVVDGLNGLALEPSPVALAEGMERLWADRAGTREMGAAAYQTLARKQIDWEHVLDTLLS
jgi:glycosyltransferase involved in cell wall biosynthesis